MGVAKSIEIGGNAHVAGAAKIDATDQSTTTTTGALVVAGGVGVGKNLQVGGNSHITGSEQIDSTTDATSSVTGALVVAGGAGIAKNLEVGGNAHVVGSTTIDSTTDSTSNTTGALKVAGGAGIQKTLTAGIDLHANRDVSADRYVIQNTSILLPAGSLFPYAGAATPGGYLLCNGSAVSRSVYSDLFAAIGVTYGSGNGVTTFNLPDLQGRMVLGVSGSHTLGSTGGAENHTMTTNEMPSHTHTGTTDAAGSHTHSISDPGHHHLSSTGRDDGNVSNLPGQSPPGDADPGSSSFQVNTSNSTTGISINSAGSHSHTFTTNATGSGTAFSVLNPFLSLNYIIKC